MPIESASDTTPQNIPNTSGRAEGKDGTYTPKDCQNFPAVNQMIITSTMLKDKEDKKKNEEEKEKRKKECEEKADRERTEGSIEIGKEVHTKGVQSEETSQEGRTRDIVFRQQ